jgi:hypothetical protein
MKLDLTHLALYGAAIYFVVQYMKKKPDAAAGGGLLGGLAGLLGPTLQGGVNSLLAILMAKLLGHPLPALPGVPPALPGPGGPPVPEIPAAMVATMGPGGVNSLLPSNLVTVRLEIAPPAGNPSVPATPSVPASAPAAPKAA